MSRLTRFVAVVSLGLMLACGGSVPLTAAEQVWAGKWVAPDGTYVHVFMDGGGSYKGSNTSIEGGSTTIAADKLTIGMGPITKELKIDQAPTDNAGVWTVTLDGVVFTKE